MYAAAKNYRNIGLILKFQNFPKLICIFHIKVKYGIAFQKFIQNNRNALHVPRKALSTVMLIHQLYISVSQLIKYKLLKYFLN